MSKAWELFVRNAMPVKLLIGLLLSVAMLVFSLGVAYRSADSGRMDAIERRQDTIDKRQDELHATLRRMDESLNLIARGLSRVEGRLEARP